MDFFDKNFLRIRNNHVFPKIHYGIKKDKYKFWNLKEILTTKIISLNKLTGKSYELEISEEDYYKALHCEIELFLNKTMVQYHDFKNQDKISKTWSFVTLYYFVFFNVTLLFRFLDKGFIFLSREQSKRINDFSLAMYSSIINVDSGNYYFSLNGKNSSGNLIINISFKGDSVHKTTWNQFEETLDDFVNNSNNYENLICDLLLKQFRQFKSEYPSNLRNKLNYNGESSMLDIENLLIESKIIDLNPAYLKSLAKINLLDPNPDNLIKSTYHLNTYIFELNKKLYTEFLDRSDYGKDFEKARKKFLNRS